MIVFILLMLTAVSASLETLTKNVKLWKPLLNDRKLSTNVRDLLHFTRFSFISDHLLAFRSLCSWPLKKELIVLSFPVSTGRLEGIMFSHQICQCVILFTFLFWAHSYVGKFFLSSSGILTLKSLRKWHKYWILIYWFLVCFFSNFLARCFFLPLHYSSLLIEMCSRLTVLFYTLGIRFLLTALHERWG